MSDILKARRAVDVIRRLGPGRTVNYVVEILRQYDVPTISNAEHWTPQAVRRIAKHYSVRLLD